MPAPNRSQTAQGSSYEMPDWWSNYFGLNGRPAPVDPRSKRTLAPDSYAPGTKGGPNRSGSSVNSGYYGPGGNPDGSGQGQAQLRTTPFGTPGINPRTGLPYSESPGKPSKPPATPEGRTNTKTEINANGVEQTMTNTSAINMPGLNMDGIANFNGPSFPTQAGTNKITAPYRATASEFLTDPKNADGSAFEIPGSSVTPTQFAVGGGKFNPDNFKAGAAGDVGGLDGFKPGGKFAGAPTSTDGQRGYRPYDPSGEGTWEGFNDDGGFKGPDPASYAISSEEKARRDAFLNAKDSMSGLKAVEAGMGIKYAGGDHYANIDGKATKMDSDGEFSARSIKNAKPGEAQALKDKWVKALSANQSEEPQLASSAQNPNEESGTSSFITNPNVSVPGASANADYRANNQEDDLSIGNKVELDEDNFGKGGFASGEFDATKFYLK